MAILIEPVRKVWVWIGMHVVYLFNHTAGISSVGWAIQWVTRIQSVFFQQNARSSIHKACQAPCHLRPGDSRDHVVWWHMDACHQSLLEVSFVDIPLVRVYSLTMCCTCDSAWICICIDTTAMSDNVGVFVMKANSRIECMLALQCKHCDNLMSEQTL